MCCICMVSRMVSQLIQCRDDHDVADNAWKGGSLNTQEPAWSERVAAGTQAWHEYVPIRSRADRLEIYRSFDFGSIATVVSLHRICVSYFSLGVTHPRSAKSAWYMLSRPDAM